ncbi:hypothetical protein [Flavobacterium fluviatile]|uniref:hypothetical protein n=1 Tax=Flavobacterium fluviatile TaxID=1862387 RepID=UPI0013D5992B|nr:hypothetical protein [Flavobacterium fluviatile]
MRLRLCLGICIGDKQRIYLYGNKFPKQLKTFLNSLEKLNDKLKYLPKVLDLSDLGHLSDTAPASANVKCVIKRKPQMMKIVWGFYN